MKQAIVGDGRRRFRFVAVALAGVAVFASAACSDRGNSTVSSAGTIAARPTETSVPVIETTPVPVDERVYRNHVASLSRTLTVELGSLGEALSNPQDTEDWLRGLTTNITQANVQLDLLQKLMPPSERYLEFDAALDGSLKEYIAALDSLTSALQAADPALLTAAGDELAAAGESFQAAAALMPPE